MTQRCRDAVCRISKCRANVFEFDMVTEGLKTWNSLRYDAILAQLIQAAGEI
jgi:hypothetical protein